MSRSPFEIVADAIDARPEAKHATDNEECRLDYVSATEATIVAHGWTVDEFYAEVIARVAGKP